MTRSTAARQETLRPVSRVGVLGRGAGFGNLLRKELRQWWATRLWWAQLLVWLVLLNAVSAAIMMDGSMSDEAVAEEALRSFPLIAATAIGIGVVLTVQGAIVGEKESGTAAWVVSKPVSRPAFILAKLVGHGIGFLVTAVAVPTVVFAVEAALLLPAPFSVPRLVVAAAVVALSMLFYLALTIALGTLFDGRGPVAGIGIGLLLAGLFFKGMLPPAFVLVTPWLLGDLAGGVAADTDITFTWAVPVVATTVMTLVLVLVAVQRFRREEF